MSPRGRFLQLVRRANNSDTPTDITFEDYISLISKPCFYCGDSLARVGGVSLDQVLPSGGYILANVVPCCGECNRVKSSQYTRDQMVIVAPILATFRKINEAPTSD